MRSRNDRVVAGVAGGMAHYFGIDPTLMRFAWVILSLAGGSGVLIYILAWIIIPEAPVGEEVVAPVAASSTGRYVIGGALILLGGLFLLQRIVPRIFHDDIFWALLLVLIGVVVVVKGARR
jgi:phage shock protein C